ncbi:MAG: FAD-dependent oxidoreductase [Sulfuricellaceae bacterium]|nr:FAD-dependent oxidoreductase [Sulfuricellaceae bacterium]
MKRRQFMGLLGASALGLLLPGASFADDDDDDERDSTRTTSSTATTVPADTGATGRVVVVGGGMAGVTAAKFLRLWGGSKVQVTLINPDTTYPSNIMSNLVLNGSTTMANLTYKYDKLTLLYGVNFVQGTVTGITPGTAGAVTLANGRIIPYDKLILAPGIEFDAIPGLDSNVVTHAWKAGAQTTLLASQLKAMPVGGTFVMTIPASPYRCPPGPYERACVVADWVKKNKGSNARVIVLDANPFIQAERTGFEHAFNVTHRGVITYIPNVTIASVNSLSRTLQTNWGTLEQTCNLSGTGIINGGLVGIRSASVLNVIPPHKAGRIITDSGIGLNNASAGRWAGVDVRSYESTAVKNIYVIGDSSSTGQPKAGHIANQEAKLCADAITRSLRGDNTPNPSPKTNSACYSPITATTASWLTVVYTYDPVNMKMVAVPGAGPTEANAATQDNFKEMQQWFANLMADSFA